MSSPRLLSRLRRGFRAGVHGARRWLLWSPARLRAGLIALATVLIAVPVAAHLLGPGSATAGARSAAAAASGLQPASTVGPPAGGSGGSAVAPDATGPAGPAGPSSLASPSPSISDAGAVDATVPGTPAMRRAVADVAVAFTRAWLAGATATSVTAWVETLRPLLDPKILPDVALTNLSAIPQASVGSADVLSLSEDTATTAVSLSDGTTLDVTLGWDGRAWRVSDYGPAAQ